MRFKARRSNAEMPEVNLIPMMDVLMTVLTFFIVVSMSLTGQQLFNINLPQGKGGKDEKPAQQTKLTIGLNPQGQAVIENQTLTQTQVVEQVQTFLSQNPQGIVVIKADRGLTYRDVSQLLRAMRDIGGDRVFLGIESQS
jgi:biopolymer transport protein ExbD